MLMFHVTRLLPGDDLKSRLQAFVNSQNIQAGCIATCVGSLTQFNIRYANQSSGTKRTGHFEILNLTGTLSINGLHLHIMVSDEEGNTVGGHLLDKCIIYTTAEIVILEDSNLVFTRVIDGSTGYPELNVGVRS